MKKNEGLAEALAKATETSKQLQADVIHVPDPVGHYMLVALPEKVEKKGQIYIPDAVAEVERAATIIGEVMAMGPDCYKGVFPSGADRFPGGPWCKVGDKVIFGRYTGSRFKINGIEFRIMSDDSIMATLTPEAEQQVSGL